MLDFGFSCGVSVSVFTASGAVPVSYTHLDVYKRQVWYIQIKFSSSTLKFMVRPTTRAVSYTHLQTAEVCTCTVKCEAGNVNENCPLCEKSLRNCKMCIRDRERPYQTNNAYAALVRQYQMEQEVKAIVQKNDTPRNRKAQKAHPHLSLIHIFTRQSW